MNTLSQTAKGKVIYPERNTIAIGFGADAVIPNGVAVALKNDGTLKVATEDDASIGYVCRANKDTLDEATVSTNFSQVVICKSDAGVTAGDLVSSDGLDTDTQKVKTVTGGKFVLGIALQTISAGGTGQIGYFNAPFKA